MGVDGQKLGLLQWALIVGCVVMAGGGNLLLKYGMSQMGSVAETEMPKLVYAFKAATKPEIIIALCAYVVSMVMWLALLSMTDISLVYPVFVSAAFILVMVVSAVWFKESVNLMRVVGTAVVIVGITLVSISAKAKG